MPYISIGQNLDYILDTNELSDNQIVLRTSLPVGDYLIFVSTDSDFMDSNTASYELTIGDVGSQGLRGPIGFTGIQGERVSNDNYFRD